MPDKIVVSIKSMDGTVTGSVSVNGWGRLEVTAPVYESVVMVCNNFVQTISRPLPESPTEMPLNNIEDVATEPVG